MHLPIKTLSYDTPMLAIYSQYYPQLTSVGALVNGFISLYCNLGASLNPSLNILTGVLCKLLENTGNALRVDAWTRKFIAV